MTQSLFYILKLNQLRCSSYIFIWSVCHLLKVIQVSFHSVIQSSQSVCHLSNHPILNQSYNSYITKYFHLLSIVRSIAQRFRHLISTHLLIPANSLKSYPSSISKFLHNLAQNYASLQSQKIDLLLLVFQKGWERNHLEKYTYV